MFSSLAQRRARLHVGFVVAALALAPGVAVAGAALPADGHRGARPTADVDASVRVGRSGRAVPRSFLGLSVEYYDLARFEQLRGFPAMLQKLEVPGAGPPLVRIGGESADDSYLPPGRGLPGDYRLTATWFSRLAALVKAAHLHVMLDLNLAARSPSMAAGLARTASAALPRGSVQSFEIGNEPDLFRSGYVGLHRLIPGQAGSLTWAFGYAPGQYGRDFRSYARAVARVAPTTMFAGPSVSVPDSRWWSALPPHGRDRLGVVTLHGYPFLTCVAPGDPHYPTVAGLLSNQATTAFAAGFHEAAARADGRGAQLRLSEMGSAACGGARGVTDTFASALWVPDALFSLLAAGVDGVNIHTRLTSLNTPLIGAPALSARPMLYGMIMFERMLGPGARLRAVDVRGTPQVRLSAWAVGLAGGTLHLLLINRGAGRARVALRLGRRSPARVLALQAPALSAGSHVTVGGASLRAGGNWDGPQKLATITPVAGVYGIALPAFSAMLVSVP